MPARKATGRRPAARSKPSKPKPKARGAAKASRQAEGARAIMAPLLARPAPAAGAAVRSITPFLWFNDNFEEAAEFYVSLFPGSRVESVHAMGGSFVLAGQRFMGLNGGPQYEFSPAVSFFVVCRDQEEVDRLWEALEQGGHPTRCGWIDDRFGLTWQIVPEAFLRMTADPDPRKVKAVFDAMMEMVKMDVAGLQAAYDAA